MSSNGEESPIKSKPLFMNLNADEDACEINEIESLCLNCGENGITRLLLTKIPFYKELIITSFSCEHCGNSNNQTQFGGQLQEQGLEVKLLVEKITDLDRQVVLSDYATVMIPELEFEIEPTSRNEVTTIEGILDRILANLEKDLPRKQEMDPTLTEKMDEFMRKLRDCRNLTSPFHFVVKDPSGNCFVENPNAPRKDKLMEIIRYKRSKEENKFLGILDFEENLTEKPEPLTEDNLTEEVLAFKTNCSNCNSPCETNMKVTKIPHFKEVVIMATVCPVCGNRSNEVKAGSGTEQLGVKITLTVNDPMDLTRDILKSETCSISIPELDFEIGAGTLGGRFTTLEGLFLNIREQLLQDNPMITGDSAEGNISQKLRDFIERFDETSACKRKVNVIFDDPAGNSYVQNLYAPDDDPDLEIVKYERSFEQNEELGLNDMKTENY